MKHKTSQRTRFNKRLGSKLLRFREESGLTQHELATKIKSNQPTVSRIEQGGGSSFYTISRILTVLEVSFLDLFS